MKASKGLISLCYKLVEKFITKRSEKSDNSQPDWLNFTSHKFGNWTWSWAYEIHPSTKKYEITDLKPLCPNCSNELISLSDSFSASKCPACNEQFHNITFWVSTEQILASINDMIKNGTYDNKVNPVI